jgi:ABC-type Mn2+/Zn2+ transport system permease subunit
MSIDTLVISTFVAGIVGIGAGYVGAFMVLRRMSLVGDALSHVALPGIAAALLIGISPFFGAFAALGIAVIVVWLLERRTVLASETLVGILFTFALALGLLLTPELELIEALFGDISSVTMTDGVVAVAIVLAVVTLIARMSHALVLGTLSADLARSSGINVRRNSLLFLVAVALIVAIGVKVTGTILTGSLVIIPAAAARNFSRSLTGYLLISSVLGGLAGAGGVMASVAFGIAAGPSIILGGIALFALSLSVRRPATRD